MNELLGSVSSLLLRTHVCDKEFLMLNSFDGEVEITMWVQ